MQTATSPTGLVVLVDFFFNSLADGVPCSLIFWHFWLVLDFRSVVILLLVVRGSEGFLPMLPSWPELLSLVYNRLTLGNLYNNLSELLFNQM